MGTHQCEMLKRQNKEIVYSSGSLEGRIATIEICGYTYYLKFFMARTREYLHVQFCPGCGKRIAKWSE